MDNDARTPTLARLALEVLSEAGGGLRDLFADPSQATPAGRASKAACQDLCRVALRAGWARSEGGVWRLDAPPVEDMDADARAALAAAMVEVARATPRPLRKGWRAFGLVAAADAVSRTEGLGKEEARLAHKDVGKAGGLMDMKATMYFAYGPDKRPGVEARTTFEAIVRGERSSTTRFDVWPGAQAWAQLEPGALVRFFEDKDKSGRFVDVAVTDLRRVDMARFSDAEMDDWSKVEGWSVAHGRAIASRGQATQVRYHPLEGEVERLRAMSSRRREDVQR